MPCAGYSVFIGLTKMLIASLQSRCGTVAFGLNNKADGLSFAYFSSISRHLGNPLWDLVKYSTLAGVPQTFNALSTILRKWLSIYKYLSFLSPFCAQSLSFAAEISSHKIISQIPISFISFNGYIYSPMLFFLRKAGSLKVVWHVLASRSSAIGKIFLRAVG